MRQADIEVGGEYAWSRFKAGSARHRVRVVEKGLSEGSWANAKKSHVLIEFLDDPKNPNWTGVAKGTKRNVSSLEIRSTWPDWLTEELRFQEELKAKQEQRATDADRRKKYEALFSGLGFKRARVWVQQGELQINFYGSEAERVVEVLGQSCRGEI